MLMKVTITLFIEGNWADNEVAEEELYQMDDADLWAVANKVTYEYDIVE